MVHGVCVCALVCVCVCVHLCVCVCVYMYLCTCVCINDVYIMYLFVCHMQVTGVYTLQPGHRCHGH